MKARTFTVALACIPVLFEGGTAATTPVEDEITVEQLDDLEASFIDAASEQGTPVSGAAACTVDSEKATCFGKAGDLVIVGTGAWSGRRAPLWSLNVFSNTATAAAAATTTTAAPPVTGNRGVVWRSAVDPSRVNQPPDSTPTFDGGNGIVVRIENALLIDATASGNLAQACRDEISFQGTSDTTCMHVQAAMDVPADYGPGEALLMFDALITPAGRQIDSIFSTTGYAGAVDVRHIGLFVGGEPSSVVRISVGSNDLGFTELGFTLPAADAFQPISFD